ncbi:MAG: hypothetical protein E7607_02585 [Ruminococcaceae bacterium]|nr:hypothetical protein [Oscillospiraceae bacterium]
MKNRSTASSTEPKQYIHIGLIMAILLFSIHALIFLVITPIYEACQTDIVIPVTICEIIRETIDILDTVVRIIGFAILAIVFFMGTQKKFPFVLIYIGAFLFRYVGALTMSYIFNHELQLGELYMTSMSFVLDLVFLGIALLIISRFAKAYRKYSAIKQKRSPAHDGKITLNSKALYPFGKVYNSQNLLQCCFLVLGIYLSLIKIANRSIAIINQGFTNEFLYFDSNLALFGGYAVDILTFAIAYGVACLVAASFYKLYMRKKTAYEIFSAKEIKTADSEDTAV